MHLDSTEEQARDYLRHTLWRIRKALQAASATQYLRSDDIELIRASRYEAAAAQQAHLEYRRGEWTDK